MLLYHYTHLIWFSSIMKDGILPSGELPIADPRKVSYHDVAKAVNLTTNADREAQSRIWANVGGAIVDKTEIRLTIELPNTGVLSFRQLRERYHIPAKVLKIMCPYEERKHWYYYFDTIAVDKIASIEQWQYDSGEYRVLQKDEAASLVVSIEAEIERSLNITTAQSGYWKGSHTISLKDGVDETWLLRFLPRQFAA
jgi:hypothetical protein